MGEQSVGKSFTLNHLVDTSFAGSAMRTTGPFFALPSFEIRKLNRHQRVYGCLFLLLTTRSSWPWISRVSPTLLIAVLLVPSEDVRMTGVHSLERSAQENTLLVLFNTAISNLVREPRYCVIIFY